MLPSAQAARDAAGVVGAGGRTGTAAQDSAVGDAGGDEAATDDPLLVKNCKPTDVVDVFVPAGGTGGDGASLVAADEVK